MPISNLAGNAVMVDSLRMANFPMATNVRAPRMRLPHAQNVTVAVEGGRMQAIALKLSSTGGLLGLKGPVKSGALAELSLDAGSGTVSGLVEMLEPRKSGTGYLQPFRFVALEDHHSDALKQTLVELARKGMRES